MDLRPVAALLLVLTGTVGCADDPVRGATAPGATAVPSQVPAGSPAAGSPAAGPPAAGSPAAESPPAGGPASPFRGDTVADTEEPSGEPLTVISARAARQDGFDRVVFELAGGVGMPGWRVAYDDTPTRDGSGAAVEVKGASTLAVVITGVGYPFDTGVDELDADPALPTDLAVVTDVVVGSTFEGSYEAFIGVSAERPFTVQRLSGPARVVIDIAHR